MRTILIAKYKDRLINCFDGEFSKEFLKENYKQQLILCPDCLKPYIYCHGEVNTPYFKHGSQHDCENYYSEPETEEHLKGKLALYKWIKTLEGVNNVCLEKYIPEIMRRPDITFDMNGQTYVIEYQCTPISTEYYKRHDMYKNIGIKDIWICGTNKYLEKKELNTRFRQKEIEKNTIYYFDSENEIFIIRDTTANLSFTIKCEYILAMFEEFGKKSFLGRCKYYNNNERLLIKNFDLSIDNGFLFTSLKEIKFKDDKIIIDRNIINKINDEHNYALNLKEERKGYEVKCNNFIKKLIRNIQAKYNVYFSTMPSKLTGFKLIIDGGRNTKYYCLKIDPKNFPIVIFCKTFYTDYEGEKNYEKFRFNIEKDNIERIIKFLSYDITEAIEFRKHIQAESELSKIQCIPIYIFKTSDGNMDYGNLKNLINEYDADLINAYKSITQINGDINNESSNILIPSTIPSITIIDLLKRQHSLLQTT